MGRYPKTPNVELGTIHELVPFVRGHLVAIMSLAVVSNAIAAPQLFSGRDDLYSAERENGVPGTLLQSAMPSALQQAADGGEQIDAPQGDGDVQAKASYLDGGKLLVYLNRRGGTFYANAYINDARTNTTSIPQQNAIIAPWAIDDDSWHKLTSCVEDRFAPFAVKFTDTQPSQETNHIEAVIGGRPQDLGLPAGHGGVAPFAWDCSVISNAIVFSFAEVYTNNGRVNIEGLCDTTAQEIAHAIGADHSFNAPDVMSYLRFTETRSFMNEEVQCGEYAGRTCGIGGNVCSDTQNTYKLLADRIGLAVERAGDSISLTTEDEASGCNAHGSNASAPLLLLCTLLWIAARRAHMS